MAFKEVNDLNCDVTISLGGYNRSKNEENPSSIEGYYLGSKDVKSPRAKSGVSKLHVFQTSQGNVGVWGKTDLDRKILQVTPGVLTRATSVGMVSTPNGDMYRFKVESDKDHQIEVSSLLNSRSLESSEDLSSDEEEQDDSQLDEVVAARPIAPSRPASTPSVASQAKVQALLNKTRR